MEVVLLVSRVGADFSQNAGDIVTVPADDGARMIAAGQARAVPKQERAVKSKPKTQKAIKR